MHAAARTRASTFLQRLSALEAPDSSHLNRSVFLRRLSKHGVSACTTALNLSVYWFSPYPSRMHTMTGPFALGKPLSSLSLYSDMFAVCNSLLFSSNDSAKRSSCLR
jgi:hypothetical protein